MTDQTLDHFREHGWMRVPRALAGDDARAMREAVWGELAAGGIGRGDPASWTVERPAHLQRLKSDPAFKAPAAAALRGAIGEILDRPAGADPFEWGALFIAMPSHGPWAIPASGWHIDAKYTSPLFPATGVKVFTLFGDVAPRGGGTLLLSGSHRLVHGWFTENPPPPGLRSAEMRKLLAAHPYVRDLFTPGDAETRVARFMDNAEDDRGIALQVIETTGAAGDTYLVHPLVMHVASPNTASEPRFLLSGGITTDMWGWA